MVISFEDRIEQEVQALSKEFSGQVSGEHVHRCVKESVASLQPARLTDFVPLLASRMARERLRDLRRSLR